MFYEPKNGHGFDYDPYKAIVAPRPIGWISTVDMQGRPNIAPYSFFNAMSSRPPMVGFTSDGMKHSISNAKETGEFVYNVCNLPLLEAMNQTALVLDKGVSEFETANLATAPSKIVKAPRVVDAPAAFECKVVHFHAFNDVDGKSADRYIIVGQVVGVYINEKYIRNGRFDLELVQPVARCGYRDYAVISKIFEVMPAAENAMQVLR